jgi:hypothetical protein
VLLLERGLDRVELPVLEQPSTVVTSRPSACTPNIVQDLIGRPSSSTVQAPQLVVSQPTCVPVSPNSSGSGARGASGARRRPFGRRR